MCLKLLSKLTDMLSNWDTIGNINYTLHTMMKPFGPPEDVEKSNLRIHISAFPGSWFKVGILVSDLCTKIYMATQRLHI